MFVVNLSHWCFVTQSVQVKINDYLRSLSRVTVPPSTIIYVCYTGLAAGTEYYIT